MDGDHKFFIAITSVAATVLVAVAVCICITCVASYRRDAEMAEKGYVQKILMEPTEYRVEKHWVKEGANDDATGSR